ncbi:unnamed protein product [Pieris macdunnoughi]|uniref:Uncharacterized protein n=1 Tax=Pieris macdunnoughi TaxID=345717 RepID=A0A821T3P0_9NEOP|nr:unnamed protein product [Pieris macdunnoughi]
MEFKKHSLGEFGIPNSVPIAYLRGSQQHAIEESPAPDNRDKLVVGKVEAADREELYGALVPRIVFSNVIFCIYLDDSIDVYLLITLGAEEGERVSV